MLEFIIIIIIFAIISIPTLALFAGAMALIVGAIEKIKGK